MGVAGRSGLAERKEDGMALPVKHKDREPDRTSGEQGTQSMAPFQDVFTQMNRLFQDPVGFFGGMHSLMQWVPSIDVEETDDAYIVDMELPGARKEDVSIDISGNEVRVYGEIKQRERKGILRRQTRKVGEFDARFSLPGDVNSDKIDAELSEGVLTLRAPKLETAMPRRIAVSGTKEPE
jgi:HSP20 family protein